MKIFNFLNAQNSWNNSTLPLEWWRVKNCPKNSYSCSHKKNTKSWKEKKKLKFLSNILVIFLEMGYILPMLWRSTVNELSQQPFGWSTRYLNFLSVLVYFPPYNVTSTGDICCDQGYSLPHPHIKLRNDLATFAFLSLQ